MAKAIRIFVEQDGRTFYAYSNADFPGRSVDRNCALKCEAIQYPHVVADFDVAAVQRARQWFVDTLKPHGIVCDFDAPADISAAEWAEIHLDPALDREARP